MQQRRRGCYDYIVEASDIDLRQKAKFVSFCNHILRAAGDDADLNGFGVMDLNLGNSSWVLSRMAVEIYRRPGQREHITVRTWVNDVSRLMTTRNMVVTDGRGEKIAAAVTQWAIIDLDQRKALDIRSRVDYERVVSDEPSPIALPARVPHAEGGRTVPREIVYSDIDFNGHVNGMKYIEWMLDMHDVERFGKEEIRRADINFIHESVYGNPVSITLRDGPCAVFEVAGPDNIPRCRACFEWV